MNFSYYGLSLDVSRLGLDMYQTQLLFGAVEVPSKLLVDLLVRHVGHCLVQAGMLLGTTLALGSSLLVTTGSPTQRPRLLCQEHSPSIPLGEPPILGVLGLAQGLLTT